MDLVKGAASGALAGFKDAIGVKEPEDTGEAFERRGHVGMQAHYDQALQRWVFPGEDPMAPTEEEKREMHRAHAHGDDRAPPACDPFSSSCCHRCVTRDF